MEKGNLLVIANPCSGKGRSRKIAPKVANKLTQAGFNVTLLFTEKSGDATNFASQIGYNYVVAMGGDGTLNETISGLVGSSQKDVVLGYIPMGSTNDFARSVGIPSNWKKAVQVIIEGKEQNIDVCKFEDRFFSYVAAHGIFAETSCSVSQKLKNKIGHLAYLLLGIKEVFRKNNYPIKIEVDGYLIEDNYAFLGFGNTKSIGGILKLKDDVVGMSDGVFEVLLVKHPQNIWQLSKMMRKFAKSEWQGDGLELLHAKEVNIYTNEQMLWSLDGEKFIINKDAKVEIVPSAIKIKVMK